MSQTNYLSHYGILGQKWGVRRFQNPDGTLTEEGKRRYLQKAPGMDGKEKTFLSDAGAKAFVKRDGRLTREGEEIVNKDPNSDVGKAIRSAQLSNKYYHNNNFIRSHNKASQEFNAKIGDLNKKYDGTYDTSKPGWEHSKEYKTYVKAVGKLWTDIYGKILLDDYGEDAIYGKQWIKNAFLYGKFDEELKNL